ncbi:MAG: ATPase domain-containing protein [archaeon]
MDKIKSGVNGFDELFDGGLPRGSNTLIFGRAGSGKTLLSLEFIFRGASSFNEPGVFVSFDQTQDELIAQCDQFGWNIRKCIKDGKMTILSFKIEDVDRDFANHVIDAVKRIKAKRLVIDNLALLTLSPLFGIDRKKFVLIYKNKIKIATNPKQLIYSLMGILKDLPLTTLYLTVPGKGMEETDDGISEYICDGIISLGVRSLGKSFLRTIEVKKMRRSNIRGGIHSFKFTNKGMQVEL